MSRSLADMLYAIPARCQQLFDVTIYRHGAPVDEATLRTRLPHADWIPESVWRYARTMNGLNLEWKGETGDPDGRSKWGLIDLFSIENIYSTQDWSHDIDLDNPEFARMRVFHPVDYYNEVSWAGLFHDEAQDPGLYTFTSAEGQFPYPLHVDLEGYISLLEYTLGYADWPLAILALLPNDGRNPIYEYGQYAHKFTADFRRHMHRLVPGFSYEDFVALYHRVKLTNYTPSS